jgi:hypothetical protein
VWAYDLSDNIGKDSITVTTLNLGIPPVAEAGEDHLVLAGSEVEIDGSASYDPNGSLTSYSWSNGKTGAIVTRDFPGGRGGHPDSDCARTTKGLPTATVSPSRLLKGFRTGISGKRPFTSS